MLCKCDSLLSHFVQKDKSRSLACAVFGEVQSYKNLVNFQPVKGAILANATPIGMHPDTDRIPVAEVLQSIF